MKDIAYRLKEVRNYRGLSQRKLAEKLGISIRTIQNYEKGAKEPTVSIMKNIAQICNVNDFWLYVGKGEMLLNDSTKDTDNHNSIVISNSSIRGDIQLSIQKHKKEVTQKEDEFLEAYRSLSKDLQDYHYHQIKADSLKAKIKHHQDKV